MLQQTYYSSASSIIKFSVCFKAKSTDSPVSVHVSRLRHRTVPQFFVSQTFLAKNTIIDPTSDDRLRLHNIDFYSKHISSNFRTKSSQHRLVSTLSVRTKFFLQRLNVCFRENVGSPDWESQRHLRFACSVKLKLGFHFSENLFNKH